MANELTELESAYVKYRAQNLRPTAAARAAGYAHPKIEGQDLEHRPKVREALAAVRKKQERKFKISREEVLKGFMDAVQAASNSMELTAAWREIGKMLGYYEAQKFEVEQKVEHTHTLKQLEQLPEDKLLQLAQLDDFVIEGEHDRVE